MKRLLPRSLLGQMILLMGAALLIAQVVNFSVLLNREQRLSLAQNQGPAIARFVQTANLVVSEGAEALPPPRGRRRGSRMRFFSVDGASIVATAAERDAAFEARLRSALAEAGIQVREVRARRAEDSAASERISQRRRERGDRPRDLIFASARFDDGQWLNARLLVPRSDPLLIQRLLLATIALYALALGAVIWIGRRIVRPLRDLTAAAESFEGRNEIPRVEPRGPEDVRRAVEAFNGMNERVGGLLDEKDRMLGAIGHDLRTPLASMRIRAESMDPEEEREALVRTIREMSETLEDILVLARTGRSREAARKIDVSALVDSAVEDFHTMGKQVEFEESPRLALEVRPNLLRRAVRNLIDNAIAYGERARVRVVAEPGGAAIEVDDDGPGIPDDQLEDVLRPFERLESSRSRETGGTGLGLAIARAVAEAHDGSLVLSNRPEGGLRARLTL